ncbi:MAG: DUF3794 domain-containing protein [Eubacteriales bacterium]|nr:DUF3794 domain-containing protein [Eubacteriales bacterium]
MELCKEYKSMNCNEKTENICESFELDYQLNLPQYLDDIEKLIKCCVTNVVCDYEFGGNSIKIFGKSLISILYLDSQGCPLSSDFEEEFSKTFDLNGCDYFYFADVKLSTKYSNHRLINQRRIDVHSCVGISIDAYCKNPKKCLAECKEALIKKADVPYLADKNAGVCSAEFDETFSIPKSDYQIKNIINAFLTTVVEDKKIIKDKMLVKVRNEISVVYVSENNSIEKCMHTFSVSKIIETSECDENDTAFVTSQVSQLYVKAKTDSGNMLNDIEAVGKLSLFYQVCAIDNMDIIVDAYVPHFVTDTQNSNMLLRRSPVYYFDDKTAEIVFDCDRSIVEILDLNASIINCSVVKSVMKINVLLKAVYYDDSSELCYLEKSNEFSFTLNDNQLDGEGIATLMSFDFVIKNTDKISLRLNFEYSAFLFESKILTYLADMEVKGEMENMNIPELTLYFADENESVWDIAKSFSTASQLIIDENELTSDVIENRRVLLVPGM